MFREKVVIIHSKAGLIKKTKRTLLNKMSKNLNLM